MNRGPASLTVALVALIALNVSLPTACAGWVADGSLVDWGFTGSAAIKNHTGGTPSYGSTYVGHHQVSNFINEATPSNPSPDDELTVRSKAGPNFSYQYVMEDSDDSWNTSQTLGPNRGGQDYDSEFMGIGRYGDQVVIAILTGQREDNVVADYAPGDIKITTSKGVFGVEVGGGIGGGVSNGVTTLGGAGTTYQTNRDGYTVGVLDSNNSTYNNGSTSYVASGNSLSALKQATSANNAANPLQTAGSIWFNPTWLKDPIPNPTTDVQIEYGTGTKVGMASSYIYSQVAGTQHAVIEVSIPIALFMEATITEIEWSPSCGNDVLAITNLRITTNPEPASLALMGIGGLASCVIGIRRRRAMGARQAG